MGALMSRFRKSKTTTEILEEIDKSVVHLEKFRRANQELRQKVIGKLILYSVIVYIVGALSLYFFFMPQEWSYRIYGLLPFFLFPFLVYLLKRILHWFFVRMISQNEMELQSLKDQRKDILENVMETETYKKAKEILEKFDPEFKRKLEEEKKAEEERLQAITTPQPGLRRRQVPTQPIQPASTPLHAGRGRGLPNHNFSPISSDNRILSSTAPASIPSSPTVLTRPILPLDKSFLDKLMDYMIGDGANQRYALICQRCASHNGMALKEEFQYLAFSCAYCRFFNPARKQRPNAPLLPVSTPRHAEQNPVSSSTDSDAESDAESQSTATENIQSMNTIENRDEENASASEGIQNDPMAESGVQAMPEETDSTDPVQPANTTSSEANS